MNKRGLRRNLAMIGAWAGTVPSMVTDLTQSTPCQSTSPPKEAPGVLSTARRTGAGNFLGRGLIPDGVEDRTDNGVEKIDRERRASTTCRQPAARTSQPRPRNPNPKGE